MPKENPERIIDSPYTSPTSRGGAISIGTGGGGGGGGATNLDALTDVTVSAPLNGQVLAYNTGSGQWINSTAAAGVPNPHGLSSAYHSGTLNWPLINFAGSNMTDLVTHRHLDLQGMTPNDHHSQLHVLATGTALGPDHSISGASAGEVLRALGPTTAAFDVLQHTDLGSVLPDQHHTRAHDIITGDPSGIVHTVVGADFTVVGVHPANNLALLPTSSAPGAAVSILKTDADGGIQLDTNLLYVDGANNRIGVNVVPGAGPLGAAAALDIRASSTADVTQRIRQLHGQNQRLWRVEDEFGNELIVMDSDGSLMSGHPLFVSGLTGWNITPEGNAEFNNIWARGELHATVFVKDEVHATGGTFMVATAGVLHDDAVINSTAIDEDVLWIDSIPAGKGVPLQVQTTSSTFTGTELHVSFIGNVVNINDPPSGPAFYFQPGDIIRVKTEIANPIPPDTLRLADLWLEVNSAIQYDGYATYSIFKRSGSDCKIPKGTALVSYGKQGDGRILMTSDLQFAPYIDVFTTGTNVWLGAAGSTIERMRMGRLDGLKVPGVAGVEQYGMIAGSDLTDANQGYFIASNKQVALYKIPIRVNDGTNNTGLWTPEGNFFLGTNIGGDPVNSPMAATTGFRVYTTGGLGASPGDVIIGDVSKDNYLQWSQLTGSLIVHGQLTVSGGGSGATVGYVDTQDQIYDAKANTSPTGYAGIAQAAAQAYGDQRRIVGVTGSWDSPGVNQIRWGTGAAGGVGVAVAFANPSGSRAIANPAAPGYISLSVRTYLYVSMAGSGTMTMLTTTSIATVSAAGNVLIAVCDPGNPAASVSVVAGSTYISGGNIFTGSITASNIASRTITADKIVSNSLTLNEMAGDVTGYGDGYRVLGVTGTWTSTAGNVIGWVSLQIKFGSGSTRNISGNSSYTLTPAGRHYLFVDYSLQPTGTMTMQDNQSLAAISPTCVLIAIADTGPDKVSVNVVAGSTYIGGGNIFAQSVNAGNIVANSITVGQMHPAYTQTITDAATAASNAASAATNAQLYGDQYKLQAVRGSITVPAVPGGRNAITWSSVILFYAGDGSTLNLTAPIGYPLTNGTLSGLNLSARSYIYYILGETTLHATTTLNELTPTRSLVAVFDPGASAQDPGSLSIVGGATYISGNNIVTGSIIATNIQGYAITADKMNVQRLSALNLTAGTILAGIIEVDGASNIHSSLKTSYGDADAGFFLGASGGTYKFDIGSGTNWLRWDGTSIDLQTSQPIKILSPDGSTAIQVTDSANSSHFASLNFGYDNSAGKAYLSITGIGGGSLRSTDGRITNLFVGDGTAGLSSVNMITFRAGGTTDSLQYNNNRLMTCTTDFSTVGTLFAPVLVASGNHINIATEKTGLVSSNGPAGNVGDIAWAQGFIYVYTGSTNGWRRATLNSF